MQQIYTEREISIHSPETETIFFFSPAFRSFVRSMADSRSLDSFSFRRYCFQRA